VPEFPNRREDRAGQAVQPLPRGRLRIDVTLRTASGRRISRSKTHRFC
jgi:hypothetical protein